MAAADGGGGYERWRWRGDPGLSLPLPFDGAPVDVAVLRRLLLLLLARRGAHLGVLVGERGGLRRVGSGLLLVRRDLDAGAGAHRDPPQSQGEATERGAGVRALQDDGLDRDDPHAGHVALDEGVPSPALLLAGRRVDAREDLGEPHRYRRGVAMQGGCPPGPGVPD